MEHGGRTPGLPAASLAHRIEETIRRLEQGPPPRSITLDLEELGAGRLTVSVGPDGVRLSAGESQSIPSGLLDELERALADGGFEMAGDADRRSSDDQEQPPRWRPAHRQARPSDDGLRL